MLNISDHMHSMTDTPVPLSYPLSTEPPLITELECMVRPKVYFFLIASLRQASQWVKIAFRGVAGAHLYEVKPAPKACSEHSPLCSATNPSLHVVLFVSNGSWL